MNNINKKLIINRVTLKTLRLIFKLIPKISKISKVTRKVALFEIRRSAEWRATIGPANRAA